MRLVKWLFGSRKPALNKPVVSGSASNIGNENEYWDAMMADSNTQITCTRTGKIIKERGVSIRRT